MKRKILILLITISIFAMLAITASAANCTAVTESKSCSKGNTVTLSVSLSNSVSGVKSGAVEVIYDSTKLQLVDAKWTIPDAFMDAFDPKNDKGAFAFIADSNVQGQVFSVTFKVLEDARLGDTEVKCLIQLRDANEKNFEVDNVPGKINITCNHKFNNKTTDYLASPASCTSPAKYYYTCSICGEKGNTTFTSGETTAHSFNKKVEIEKYLVNSVVCADTANYYYSCECGTKGSETFVGDASWSHNYSSELFVGAAGHWYGCADCGARKNYESHIIKDSVCEKCFFVMENAEDHIHSYGSALKNDSTGHWYECICGEKKDFALHSFDNGRVTKEPTQASKGETTYVCENCYYVLVEEIPQLEADEKEEGKDDSLDNQTPVVESKDNTSGIVIAVVITACSILGVEAIVFAIVKTSGKKDSTNNKVEPDSPTEDSSDANEKKGE